VKKQTMLKALLNCSPAWIKASAANPNKYMTRMDVLLHYVALRRMGEL